MSDFVVSGSLDPRGLLEGLKAFEREASSTGQRGGEAINKGVADKVSSGLPKALQSALGAAGSGVGSQGAAIGAAVSKGLADKVYADVPSGVKRALAAAGGEGSRSGQQIGANLATGVGTGVGIALPKAVQATLSNASKGGEADGRTLGKNLATGAGTTINDQLPKAVDRAVGAGGKAAGSAGKQLGTDLVGGVSSGLLDKLPPAFRKAVGDQAATVGKDGALIGSGLGSAISTGLGSTLPDGFKRVYTTQQGQAGSAGRQIGQTIGTSIGEGIGGNRELFAVVISQAQSAARQVGLTFNAVKLRFEVPSTGEVVPQAVLDRLANLNPALAAAQGELVKFTGATTQSAQGLVPLSSGFTRITEQGGLVQAAVMGFAFSLSNTLVNAAGNAMASLNNVVMEFARLDTEIRKAATAAGEPGGYERLSGVIDKVGIDAAGTQMEVAQLATSLVRAGFSVKEVESAMPGVVRGAEATGTSFEQMGSIVGNTLRGFGLDVKETARVTDVLVKAANSSNASVEGLGYTFQYAAPVAKSLKINLEDLAATAGLMANAGIDASVAGTGLRFGLNRLQKAASGASGESLGLTKNQALLSRAMRQLGADVTKADGTLRPLDQVFLALKKSLEKLDTASQLQMATAIFGDEAGAKFLSVTNQSDEAIRKMFATIRDSKGAVDEARNGMQGFELAMKQLDGTLGVIGNSFGKVIAAGIAPFLSVANTLLGAVAALPEPIKNLVAALTLLVGGYVAAKVAAVAFSRAMQVSFVQAAVKEVQVLLRFLRADFRRDLAAAQGAWRAFQAALNASSSNAAVAALAQIAQGLKNINATQTIAGFGQLGKAIGGFAAQGRTALVGLVNGGVQKLSGAFQNGAVGASLLSTRLKGMADASKLSERGLKGSAAVLQSVMTEGLYAAANGTNALRNGMASLSGATSGGLVPALQALGGSLAGAAVAMGPLLIAAAAIVPAIVGYNNVMQQSRKVTAELQPSVERSAESLRNAGIAFTDFGKQGGPMAQFLRDAQKGFEGLKASLAQIPVVAGLAQAAFEVLWRLLQSSPLFWLIKAVVEATGVIKEMYAEAGRTQAIIESQDQLQQFGEQVDKANAHAGALARNMVAMGPAAVKGSAAMQAAFTKDRQVLADNAGLAESVAAKLRNMAKTARDAGDPQLAASYEAQARQMDNMRRSAENNLKALEKQGTASGLVKVKLDEQAMAAEALTQRLIALNTAASQFGGDQQYAQKALDLAKALGDLEASRFNIVKAGLDYQLQQAERLGLSQQQQEALKQQGRQIEAQALAARYQALLKQQQIESTILQITQEKAKVDAQIAVIKAQIAQNQAQAGLNAAEKDGDKAKIAAAQDQLSLARQQVMLEQSALGLLGRTGPLEEQIAKAQGETARNAMVAEAAGKGFSTALDGTVVKQGRSEESAARLVALLKEQKSIEQQLQQLLSKPASDRKTPEWQSKYSDLLDKQQRVNADVAKAYRGSGADLVASAKQAADSLDSARKSMQSALRGAYDYLTPQLQQQVRDTAKANIQSLVDKGIFRQGIDISTPDKLFQVAGVGESYTSSAKALTDAEEANTKAIGDLIKKDWTVAVNVAANGSVTAAGDALAKALWAGGPVAAGQTVRINDGPTGRSLGQESFLSRSGQLALINRPANSLWTAPTSGVVIPASVTEGLKARGAFSNQRSSGLDLRRGSGGEGRDAAVALAHQAVAIGKLQQSVDRLVEKDWNVHVRLRNDDGVTSLNQINRMW